MNVAANLLMEDSKVEIQEIALKMGYENPGKFSSAFKSVMGVTPAKYRILTWKKHQYLLLLDHQVLIFLCH